VGTAHRVEQFLKHDLWTIDLHQRDRLQRVGIQMLRLVFAVASEFRNRLLDARAAGLVYTTLLSLVPFLAVMFSVLKAFGVHHRIEPVLGQALEPLGPKGQEITANVIGFVNNLNVGILGVLGIAGLIYTSYSLIDKIERTFNAIWRVRQGRSWGRQFTDYLSVVLVGPVLVVTAFGLLASIHSHALVQRVLEIQPFGYLVVWAAQFVPFLLLAGVFTFLYKFLPNTQVPFLSALIGGVTAAILWGLAGKVFAAFVVGSATYSAVYSGFAILIVFLMWLYASWLIILVGAQVCLFHQYPSAYQVLLSWTQGAHAFREYIALALLVGIARRYLKGEGLSRETDLVSDLNVPPSIVQEQIDELVAHGILCRMSEPEGVGLVKPPELIPVTEVLNAIRHRALMGGVFRSKARDEVEQLLRRRDQAVEQALTGITLRSLVLQEASTAAGSEAPVRLLP
jgi:membrane protein